MSVSISIIIPVYNCERYLKRCLDSVCAQTFKDFEVIMVNDGSTDQSERICREYIDIDHRFHLISQTNQGQAAARNVGIQRAKGEWIHFIDADDAIHPQMLEILYDSAVRTNAGISMCGFVEGNEIPPAFFDKTVLETREILPEEASEKNMCDLLSSGDKKYWVVWGKLIRKNIIERIPFEPGRIYEDNAVICKWFYYAESFVDVQRDLYFYFQNPTGTTKSVFSEKQLDRLWAIDEQSRFFESVGYMKMRSIMDTRYVIACASCYKLADTKVIKKRIKRSFFRKLVTKKARIQLTAKERIHVLEAFCPFVMAMYWLVKGKISIILEKLS